MADFIQKFHNLEGITLAEQYQNLYKLLNSKNYRDHQDYIVKNLQPKNPLQKQLFVDILIYFRRIPELVEIFNDGDERSICKLLKHDWFVLEVFQNLEIEKLVNEYLPEYSYSTRMKFLKKFSTLIPMEKAEYLYDCLLKKYGLCVAKQFLFSCSVDKILNELTINDPKLSTGQLRKLFCKEPQLVLIYIDNYEKSEKFNDKKFIKFIAAKDWSYTVLLIQFYDLETTFGKRTTRKIIKTAKNTVLTQHKLYSKFLKKNVVTRKLQRDFREFYLKIFPRDYVTFKDFEFCNEFLKHAPPRYKFDIFSKTFLEVIKDKPEDHPDVISNDAVLNMMRGEDVESCNIWATKKYEETKDIKYVKYMRGEKVFTVFKQRFRMLRTKEQQNYLLLQIVDSCHYNDDLNILEGVFQFLCEKINLIDRYIIDNFMDKLNSFGLDSKFNEKLWNYCIYICKNKAFYWKDKMILKYFAFLFKNGLSLGNSVQSYINLTLFGPNIYFYDFRGVDVDFVRFLLLEMIGKCSELDNVEENSEKILKALNEVLKFNRENPEKSIDIYQYPKILSLLMKPIKSPYLLNEVLAKILCKKTRNEVDKQILDYYFKYNKSGQANLVPWFFKNDPKFFVEHFDLFLGTLLTDDDFKIWGELNFWKFSPVNLDCKLRDFLLLKFKDHNVKPDDKVKYVNMLAQLLPSEDFVELTEDLVPKINLENKVDLYKLQREVVRAYKKCSSMKIVKNVVLEFCVGDFLQPALTSLYSVAHRIPEKDLTEIIRNLQGGAVSVRKHSFFLACLTMDNKFTIELFKEFAAKENNVSMQKHIFASAVKYLIKNPSEETWSLVKKFTEFIPKSDEETLTQFIQLQYKIPLQYKQSYWELVYQFLKENKEQIPDTYIRKHFKNAKQFVKVFSNEFCETIIKDNLQDIDYRDMVLGFTTLYIIEFPEVEIFDAVFTLIHPSQLDMFFEEFLSHYRKHYFSLNALDLFSMKWKQVFTPVERFREYIILKTLRKFCENTTVFAEYFGMVILRIIKKYSPLVMRKLGKYIYYTLTHLIYDNRIDIIIFLEELRKNEEIWLLTLILQENLTEKERKKYLFKSFPVIKREPLCYPLSHFYHFYNDDNDDDTDE